MALRTGQTGAGGVNNGGSVEELPDDDESGGPEYDALLAAMGVEEDDENKEPRTETGTEPPTQTQQQRAPAQPGQQPTQPSQPQQAPADLQTALHRLSQYEQTLIPQLQRQSQQLQEQVRAANQSVQGVQEYLGVMQQFGLSPSDAQIGLQMAASYRRDPVTFLKSLINNTRANGVDLSALNVQANLDPGSVAMMLDQRLKPILDRLSQDQRVVDERNRANEQINQFFQQYPDAYPHHDMIGQIMNASGYDMVRSYYELKMWAQQNQLNWQQPLLPQYEARQNGGVPQNRGNGTSFPATRRVTTNAQPVNAPQEDQFGVDVDWKTIVRQAVSQANGAQ